MQAKQVLHKLMKRAGSMMHQARRQSVEANVLAALSGARLTVTDLGRSIDSDAKQKHCIKRADRLLSNPHVHAERCDVYAAVTRFLIGRQQRPIIIVDWSDMDAYGRHYLLRASIPMSGRSLTLYEEIHTVKTKEKPKTLLAFLRALKAMLPASCRPIIVSDAGFRVPWFKLVESFGWDWAGRVRNRTLVQRAESTDWMPCKTLYALAQATPKTVGAATIARNNPMPCQLVVCKAKATGRIDKNRWGKRSYAAPSRQAAAQGREPWLLATSLPPCFQFAKKIVTLYQCRMQIEESFRDLKSTRFGLSLELHLSYQPARLQTLLLIAALALMVAWLMGQALERTGQHRDYQANTVRNRRVLSTIFLGLRVINEHRAKLSYQDISQAERDMKQLIQCYGSVR